MENEQRTPAYGLNPKELRHFFISHLNRIYCAKSKLAEKLPELAKRSHFLDLQQAIEETVEIVQNQLARIKEIYIRLDAFYYSENCTGLVGILDEAFQSIGTGRRASVARPFGVILHAEH